MKEWSSLQFSNPTLGSFSDWEKKQPYKMGERPSQWIANEEVIEMLKGPYYTGFYHQDIDRGKFFTSFFGVVNGNVKYRFKRRITGRDMRASSILKTTRWR
jgi:hypothetical protein